MKILIVSVILFFSVPISLQCQDELPITRGKILFGGNFYGSFYWDNDLSRITIATSPNMGYFVIDNFVLGFTFPIEYIKSGDNDNLFVGFGPYSKYYFDNGLFTVLQVGGMFLKPSNGSDVKAISISPGFGYAYFISKNISLEMSLDYGYYKIIDKEFAKDMYNVIQLKAGFYIFL